MPSDHGLELANESVLGASLTSWGVPVETPASLQKTIDYAKRLGSQITIFNLRTLSGHDALPWSVWPALQRAFSVTTLRHIANFYSRLHDILGRIFSLRTKYQLINCWGAFLGILRIPPGRDALELPV